MTKSEALTKVEEMLTALRLVDRFGDPIEGLEGIGVVARHFPDELERLENEFFGLRIKPEDYVLGIGKLLERFKQIRFANALDKRLASLKVGA